MDTIANIYREDGIILCEVPIINLKITCEFISITELADMRVKVSVDYGQNTMNFTTRKADLHLNTDGLKKRTEDDKKTVWQIDWHWKEAE